MLLFFSVHRQLLRSLGGHQRLVAALRQAHIKGLILKICTDMEQICGEAHTDVKLSSNNGWEMNVVTIK